MFKFLIPFSLLILMAGITVFAQTSSATLNGTVQDENGAVIPGAAIAVVNDATSIKRTATTNESGLFTVSLLPPGKYSVLVEHEGFTRVQLTNIVLNVGDEKTLTLQLKVGDVKTEVVVTQEAPLINDSPGVSTVVDRQFVSTLPLSGRSFQSLLELTPGVTLFKTLNGTNGGGQFSINGQRTNANYFMVDGVSANVGITTSNGSFAGNSGAGELPANTALGTTQSLVSVDALQEFRVQTSTYAPEFGRTPGGQISMVTRSGENSFHGTAFEYFRNEALDATDWFANANRLPKPPDRQNDFGGTFGGPMFLPHFGEGGLPWYNGRNRTFFFFSYEGLRLRLPQATSLGVPDLCLRGKGGCVAGQNAGNAATAPAQVLLNAFPLPNGPEIFAANGTPTATARFAAGWGDPSSFDATALRIDHTLNSRVSLFGRYSHTPSESSKRSGSLSNITTAAFSDDSFTVGTTGIIRSNVTNDLRVNWTRVRGRTAINFDPFGGAVLPPDDVMFASPLTRRNAFFTVGMNGVNSFSFGTGNDNFQRQFNLVEGVNFVKGGHAFKFGVDYRRISPILNRSGGNFLGEYFDPPSNAIAGQLSEVIINRGGGENIALFTNFSAYFQDTWKTTRRLTLTYGVRWELNPPPTSLNGRPPVTVVDIRAPGPITLAPRGTALWNTTYDNFAPRFGGAYEIGQTKGRELIVRGGFGLFYDVGFGPIATAFDSVYPYFASKDIFDVPYPLLPADAQPPVPGVGNPQQLWIMDRHLKLPFTYQWNVAAEQALGTKNVFTASYVGAIGRRLLRQETYRPQYPEFGNNRVSTFWFGNKGTSDYKALQFQFQRRLSSGLQALANYTFSKSTDTSSDDFSTQSSVVPTTLVDPSRDQGASDFDVRHVFTSGISYNLPKPAGPAFVRQLLGNWGVDGLIRIRSAFPLNVLTVVQFGGINYVVLPNIIPGVPLYVNDPTAPGGRIINNTSYTAADNPRLLAAGCVKVARDAGDPSSTPIGRAKGAFCTPLPNTVGNFGRNSLRGFPAQQIDMTLRRQFGLTEKLKLQLRFEVFNVFNHPNFGDPATNIAASNFGRSALMLNRGLGGLNALYQIGGPRSAQVAAKFVF